MTAGWRATGQRTTEGCMETWKDIPGYEGKYQVSDLGRLRNAETGVVLSPSKPRRSLRYMSIPLGPRSNNKTFLVHRLVAFAFFGPPLPEQQVNHKNGNVLDNRACNLEWCSPSENARHSRHVLGNKYPGKGVSAMFPNGEVRTWENQRAAETELVGGGTGIVSWALRKGRPALGAIWSRA